MNEVDVIKTIADHLSERKKTAALSNYKVLCNTIQQANDLFSSGVETVKVFHDEVEGLLKTDENVLDEAKNTANGIYYFRRIAPVILANDLLILQRFLEATRPDDREGTSIESIKTLERGFAEFNDLATTTRQFFDSLVANAFQLIFLDAKETNYQVLQSLRSFYKFATRSLVYLVFDPNLENSLREFESLSPEQQLRGEESHITKASTSRFKEKLEALFNELGLNDYALLEKIDSIFKFSSDFTHIGYVSTHLVGGNASEVIFGDEDGPYLPSTENFSELKYDILAIANRFMSEIYLPILIRFAEKILVSARTAPLKETLAVAGTSISKGMETHFRDYIFPIKDGLVGSSETIDLTCQCGQVRKWAPPHEDSERYCERCGSSFGLIVLSGGGYIMTSEGPVRILGSTEPFIGDEMRAELISKHLPSPTVEVEDWSDEQFQQLSQIQRDLLSSIAHFGSSCDIEALCYVLPNYGEEEIKNSIEELLGRGAVLTEHESKLAIASFLRDAALKSYPNPDE